MGHRSFLLIAFMALFHGCGGRASSVAIGTVPAPITGTLPLRSLEGEPTTLAAVASGRPAVVALWATWCESCRREVPALRRLDERARLVGDFVVVAIAVGGDAESVQSFVERNRATYRHLLDDQERFAEIGERRVPTILVVDGAGRTVHQGRALDRAALDALGWVRAQTVTASRDARSTRDEAALRGATVTRNR